MTDLDALLGELRTKADALAKAQPAPEVKAVETAAAAPAQTEAATAAAGEAQAAAAKTEEGQEAAAAAGGDGLDTDEGEEVEGDFGKSFFVTDADGNKVPAVDGFAVIKSLVADITALRGELAELKATVEAPVEVPGIDGLQKSFTDGMAGVAGQTETMAKALTVALEGLATSQADVANLSGRIEAQDALVKSLSTKLDAFGATGSGRRSTVSVHEKPSPAAVADVQPTVGELFAKASTLISAGKLSGADAARVNAWVNAGRGIPPELAALFAAA